MNDQERIKELEYLNNEHRGVISILMDEREVLRERIAELEAQTKPLSDEEIWEVIDNCFGVHAFNLDYQIALDEAREDAFELVKAILRKAQDK